LMLVGTLVASPAGFVKITAGAVCAFAMLRPLAQPTRSNVANHLLDCNKP